MIPSLSTSHVDLDCLLPWSGEGAIMVVGPHGFGLPSLPVTRGERVSLLQSSCANPS